MRDWSPHETVGCVCSACKGWTQVKELCDERLVTSLTRRSDVGASRDWAQVKWLCDERLVTLETVGCVWSEKGLVPGKRAV
jgi:hypothetical protein